MVLCCFEITTLRAETLPLEKLYISQEIETAKKAVSTERLFDVDESGTIKILIMAMQPSDIEVEVQNSIGDVDMHIDMQADSGQYREELEGECPYLYQHEFPLKKGKDYQCRVTFAVDNHFILMIGREGLIRKMPQLILTEGTSTTCKTSSYKAVSWNSSDSKIVTVKNGKVIAKKKGTAKVTAYVKDSLAYVWNVSVKENVYEERPIELSKKNKNKKMIQVYRASYVNKKLVLKIRIVNNTSINYEKLQNLKLNVKSADGKKIGCFELGSKNVKISKHSVKNLTFTINKPKTTKADLRSARITAKGTLFYMK